MKKAEWHADWEKVPNKAHWLCRETHKEVVKKQRPAPWNTSIHQEYETEIEVWGNVWEIESLEPETEALASSQPKSDVLSGDPASLCNSAQASLRFPTDDEIIQAACAKYHATARRRDESVAVCEARLVQARMAFEKGANWLISFLKETKCNMS